MWECGVGEERGARIRMDFEVAVQPDQIVPPEVGGEQHPGHLADPAADQPEVEHGLGPAHRHRDLLEEACEVHSHHGRGQRQPHLDTVTAQSQHGHSTVTARLQPVQSKFPARSQHSHSTVTARPQPGRGQRQPHLHKLVEHHGVGGEDACDRPREERHESPEPPEQQHRHQAPDPGWWMGMGRGMTNAGGTMVSKDSTGTGEGGMMPQLGWMRGKQRYEGEKREKWGRGEGER